MSFRRIAPLFVAPYEPLIPVPPSARPGPPGEDLRRLGQALEARAHQVLELTVARTQVPGHIVAPVVQESFERICTSSTLAIARWMAGGDVEAAREAGTDTWMIFGELSAHRGASLNEVMRRSLFWRDAVAEVLREITAGAPANDPGLADALPQALNILQLGLEFTLVRLCECFEAERERAEEELRHREEQLAFLATHDALTRLPNRTLIIDRLQQMLARSRRHQTPVAALFIDLDGFKSINDTLGHAVGDELLQAVAARLDGVIRGADALGRLGGDEFVVIAEDLPPETGPEPIAERLLEALSHPFQLGENKDTRVIVTASIGIAVGDRTTADELLRNADIAMYRAKWDGKNCYAVFVSGMEDGVQRRVELELELREAVARGEFFLAYQPTVALSDLRPNGVEALIRWRHPTRGVVGPDDFIGVLEEMGLICEVGRWVLDQACAQGALWRDTGHPIGIAVNVSGRQLDTDQLVEDIASALGHSGLEPQALTIEITETTLMRNIEQTARRLAAIKALGVRIAIDDFGTGYSSLAHLQRFPVDALKIDRSFISALSHSREGETLLHSLVQLGKGLSMETLAEGIEQEQELALLRDEACDSGQGFLIARPLDPTATEAYLRQYSSAETAGDSALAGT
jgi:diguanylate cyclase (GGDEF)-like protein